MRVGRGERERDRERERETEREREREREREECQFYRKETLATPRRSPAREAGPPSSAPL